MVLALPGLPSPARPPARRAAADARVGYLLLALPARRADRGARRLSGGQARSRSDAEATCELGSARDRAVDGPDGRVHGVGRDDGARPSARHRPRFRARRGDGRRLPARHVRPRRPDAPTAPARRVRARGRLARSSRGGGGDRVLVGGAERIAGARRIPLRLVLERPRHPRRRQAPRVARPRLRERARLGPAARLAPDERDRPPDAATVARSRRRGSERPTRRVRVRGHVAAGVSGRPADRGSRHRDRRAPVGGAGQPLDGSRFEPRRCPPGVRSG